jgi:hypothetical protein
VSFRIWRDPAARAAFDWKAGPQPGFYRVHYVRGGPAIPAEIRYGPPNDPVTGQPLDRSWVWELFVEGQQLRLDSPDSPGALREAITAVATWGGPITKEEYDFLLQERAWVRRYAAETPEADPRKAADLGKEPLVY